MISETIKQIRKTHYLNQTEFANRIGVTQGAVSQWENGLTRPNLDQLRAISAAFNISIDDIMKETAGPGRDLDAINIKQASVPILGSIACGERVTPEISHSGLSAILHHREKSENQTGFRVQPGFSPIRFVLHTILHNHSEMVRFVTTILCRISS